MLIDYTKYFENRVIIITGAGRSGTTILGKIVGSMEPAYYLFEPTIMKAMLLQDLDDTAMLMTLLEDYWAPKIQGRACNNNINDDSWDGHYYEMPYVWHSMMRNELLTKVSESKLVIKLTDIQPSLYDIRRLFPGVKIVHIIRNGNDVISSAVKRRWFTDNYMKHDFLDVTYWGVPWMIDEEVEAIVWKNWNPETRAACMWRTCVETGLFESDHMITIRYEDLIAGNMDVNSLANDLGLTPTSLTWKHMESVGKRGLHKDITGRIAEPERGRFMALMKELKYV